MKYAQILGSTITRIWLDPQVVELPYICIQCPDTTTLLHTYDERSGNFNLSDVDAAFILSMQGPKIFKALTPVQIRLALTATGLRAAVEAAVLTDPTLKDWWEFSSHYDRYHPIVISMIATLGVTDTQADSLWALGATL